MIFFLGELEPKPELEFDPVELNFELEVLGIGIGLTFDLVLAVVFAAWSSTSGSGLLPEVTS